MAADGGNGKVDYDADFDCNDDDYDWADRDGGSEYDDGGREPNRVNRTVSTDPSGPNPLYRSVSNEH